MSEGFFDRWSRRKQEARDSAAPVAAPTADGVPPATPAAAASELAAVALPADEPGAAPPPTLADTTALTIDSDFKPFLAKGVAPEVKNAAFKKLFADPHFNVMDRMDIYIDDYSVPSPLPDSMLRQMASAKFLKLFDEAPEAPADAGAMTGETPKTEAVPAVAQSEPSAASAALPSPLVADAQPASQPTDDPNADLRLQPDDAARAEDARHRAG